MGFFGLGVLGITYGVLSASWDEERSGSLMGLGEFGTNWGRMVEVWRETRQNNDMMYQRSDIQITAVLGRFGKC